MRRMPSFVVKSTPQPDDAELLEFDEKTMWRGKTIRPGDEVFLFAAEHKGGRGLYARGVVEDAIRAKGIRVRVKVRRAGAAARPLGRLELRASRDRPEDSPGAEIEHKLYRQATNKIAGVSEAAAVFLRSFF